MPNEDMVVIGAIARKGGAGKTTLLKSFLSAAVSGKRRCLALDTDPQRALYDWSVAVGEAGLASERMTVRALSNTAEVETEIDRAYEAGDVDFVFIDTPGEGGGWADTVAVQCDHIVTPIMLSSTDIRIGKQTTEWFAGLRARAEDPSLLPAHHVVLNRVKGKTTKGDDELIEEIIRAFPVVETVMLDRNQYTEMDRFGLLGALAGERAKSKNPLRRVHARHYYEALDEARDVLNEIIGG